jgi:hypothetical protein
MKKIFFILMCMSAIFVSCDEWDPVYTFKYDDPGEYTPVEMTANTTIAQLKAMYDNTPLDIQQDIVIKGQVISSDRSGNIYRSLYIEDESGAIELKIGKSGLYNDYKVGQWVYVKCSGLTLGNYQGMLQLGFRDPTGEYETAYIDVQYIIDTHIFRGEIGTALQPTVLSASQILNSSNFGRYVTLKGLKYGSKDNGSAGEIFSLIYIDPDQDKTSQSNRVFLSDKTYGVTTWAMSKQGFINYLNAGNFDSATTGDGSRTVVQIKDELIANAAAYSVSQYFMMENTEVQVRTSGYAKFADTQIDPSILNGSVSVDFTGILTNYKGAAQFTLINTDGAVIVK